MSDKANKPPDPPGAILAVHLNGCIARAYGGLVPLDDVVVASTALLLDYLGRVDQATADGYRAFVIENLMRGATKQ